MLPGLQMYACTCIANIHACMQSPCMGTYMNPVLEQRMHACMTPFLGVAIRKFRVYMVRNNHVTYEGRLQSQNLRIRRIISTKIQCHNNSTIISQTKLDRDAHSIFHSVITKFGACAFPRSHILCYASICKRKYRSYIILCCICCVEFIYY